MVLTIIPIVVIVAALLIGFAGFSPELRANFLLWRGRERKARRIFEYLLELNPEKLSLYRKLAKIYYFEKRRDRKALRIFEIILKLKIPFEWRDEILSEVAKYYIIEGRKDSEAIKLIERAVDNEIKRLRP